MKRKTEMRNEGGHIYLSLIVNTLSFVVVFLLGFVGYYCLEYKWGLVHLAIGLIWRLSLALYHKIGAVVVGLIPLSIYLAVMSILVALEHLRLFSFRKSPIKKMDFVIEMGPMLGVTGTMISLSRSMSHIDMSHGVQAAIHEMSALVGQALNSSVLGVSLAIAAYLMKFFIKERRE
ncbi:MAG TPA: hypothetical protein EYP21_02375 [Syntrophaceae bacterium]|nr:hypothetical protein [Syntrophaceae bacterium]